MVRQELIDPRDDRRGQRFAAWNATVPSANPRGPRSKWLKRESEIQNPRRARVVGKSVSQRCEPWGANANPVFRGDASAMPRARPPQCYLARKDPLLASNGDPFTENRAHWLEIRRIGSDCSGSPRVHTGNVWPCERRLSRVWQQYYPEPGRHAACPNPLKKDNHRQSRTFAATITLRDSFVRA